MIDFADDDAEADSYPAVPRVPPRCPRCRQAKSRLIGQGRTGVVRYHGCLQCGLKFKSVEVDPGDLHSQKN